MTKDEANKYLTAITLSMPIVAAYQGEVVPAKQAKPDDAFIDDEYFIVLECTSRVPIVLPDTLYARMFINCASFIGAAITKGMD